MRAYAKLILPLLCAAACTGAALADELPDLPEHGAEQPPAIAENQPADTETTEETPEVSDENEENDAIQPAEPDMDSGFWIEPEPEPEPPESTPEPEPETIVLTRFDTQVNVDVAAIACGDADALHAFSVMRETACAAMMRMAHPMTFSPERGSCRRSIGIRPACMMLWRRCFWSMGRTERAFRLPRAWKRR